MDIKYKKYHKSILWFGKPHRYNDFFWQYASMDFKFWYLN